MPTKELPKQAEVNIGMIGHVDHGKTTLTYALTGQWTDTHSEELRRGISIRLGYAGAVFSKIPGKDPPEAYTVGHSPDWEALRKVSFVDAPGHETLLAVMLSGAAIMDGAVLVIAANEDCPQPQTEEHLLALSATGKKNIIVAQNKVDLVSKEEAKKNAEKIREFLSRYGYGDVPIIPTSAHHGINVDALIEAMEVYIPPPKRDESKPFKMWVARSFDVNKPGTPPKELRGGVLGGSVEQGVVKLGQEVEVSPGPEGEPIITEVVSLSAGTEELEEGRPGGLIAVGLEVDPTYAKGDKMKGQIIARPGSLPDPATEFTMEFHPIERKVQKVPHTPLRFQEMLALAIGTMPAAGIVVSAKSDEISVRTKKPVTVPGGTTVAISRKIGNRWRLVGYGVVK